MLDYYPYTVTPKEVELINNEGIPVPDLPNLPDYPKKPRKKIIGLIILILSISLFVFLNINDKIEFLPKFTHILLIYILFFVAVISLTATIFELVQNGSLKKKYLISIKLFKEQEEELNVIKEKREIIIKNNEKPEKINEYRKDAVRKYFNFCYDKIQANRNEYTAAKERFQVFLEQHFLNKAMENVQIVHEAKNIEYTPDFILKLSRPKVNIAIEIEEPYTLKEIEGHTNVSSEEKYADIKKVRTRIANELRWLVIVFSEEQIVSHPTECCKYISEFTEATLLEDGVIGDFSSVVSLSELKFTKVRDVNKLKKAKFRENYLSKYGLVEGFSEIKKSEAIKTAIVNKVENKVTLDKKEKVSLYDDNEIVNVNNKEKIVSINNTKTSEPESEQLKLIKKIKEQLKNERKVTYNQEYIDKQKKIDDEKKKKEIAEKKFQANIKSKKESISKLINSNDKNLKREALILNDLDRALKNKNDEFDKLDEKTKKEIELLVKEKERKLAELKHKEREQQLVETKRKEEERIAAEKAQKEKEEAERKEKERQLEEAKRKEEEREERIAAEKAQKEKEEAERKEKERNLVKLEKEKFKEHLSEINIIDDKGKEITEDSKNKELEEKYKKQIEEYVKDKKWDFVIETSNIAIKEIPNCYWAYYRISTAHGNKGNFNKVVVNCTKSLDINPKFSDAYFNRATANFFLKNYKDAINDYQKSIEFDYSNLSEAYFNKGLCLQKVNLKKKAYREFLKAKDLGNKKAEELIKIQYMD